ncbi:tethering complex subunit [Starmerella bacillaris]|uniref:Probable vacuolar protein sorting-associated protein 16 homolog n=1 Tax=Starmerella bacillaris TaxID=1247836 RepID=A0AAV5RDT4_STABA|nr:tethering complex subunit [Starmerella bacillaris]
MSTLQWERCGSQFFRTFEAPALKWKVPIAQSNVKNAKCGGLIAVYDRSDVFVITDINDQTQKKPNLQLFSGDGTKLGEINLDFGNITDVAITMDETIVITTQTGITRHYKDFGANFVQLRLNQGCRNISLFKNGYVVQSESGLQTLSLQFIKMESLSTKECKVESISKDLGFDIKQYVLIPEIEGFQAMQILVLDTNNVLRSYNHSLDTVRESIAKLPNDISLIKISADNKLVAFSNKQSEVIIYKTDFSGEPLCLLTDSPAHSDLFFVGNDAVALITDKDCITVFCLQNPESLAEIYFDDEDLHYFSEIDCLRILGKQSHLMLMKVSDAIVTTLKLGSVSPSAILYSCVDQIKSGSPRANQTVNSLEKPILEQAVNTCIEAALDELFPKVQEKLLRAAMFGKSVLPLYDSTTYIDALTRLRIGNNLRKLQLFATDKQISSLGLPLILSRLELRKLWPEAVAIAKLYRAPFENVYVEWACNEIQETPNIDLSDDQLIGVLDEKLLKVPALTYTKIVKQALNMGRKKLAKALLTREPFINNRIMLLLQMDDVQNVLEEALYSGNVYLVDYVLMILDNQLSTPQLMRLLNGKDLAIKRQELLLKSLYPTTSELHEFLSYMDERERSLRYDFEEIVAKTNDPKALEESANTLTNLSTRFTTLNKKFNLESKACSDWSNLIKIQTQLESDFHKKFIGKSSSETVSYLLQLAQPSVVKKIAGKLNIGDRQFWWLHLRSLSERHLWNDLYDLALSTKSPIGYQPFFDACLPSQNYELASRFVPMIHEASLEDKVKMFMKIKCVDKARELAAKSRNPQLKKLVDDI